MKSKRNYDPSLLSQVIKLGGFKSKKDAINAALKEYVIRHQQISILELFGQIDYESDYSYKKLRIR